jgi:hypothetical protein
VQHEYARPFAAFGQGEVAVGVLVAVRRELLWCTIAHVKLLLIPERLFEKLG